MKPLASIREWRRAGALAVIVLVGLMLRLYRLGSASFWFDETFSVWIARRSLGDLFAAVRQDSHPPLYMLLLHYWLYLGQSDTFIRLLSALCSTLTIPVMYLLGRRIASSDLGLLAALILAVSPFNVLFGQEARMYALLTLLVSLSMYFLARLITHRPRAVDWLGFVVFTAAAMLTHNTAVFLPVGANIYVLGRYLTQLVRRPCRHKGSMSPQVQEAETAIGSLSAGFLRNWIFAQLGILLILSPWLPAFIEQSIRVDQSWWIPAPTMRSVYDTWWELSSACAPHAKAYDIVIPALFGALATLGILYFRRQPRWCCFLVILALSPFVGELLVSLRRPIFLARTLLWFTIPYGLLLAAGLLQLRRRVLVLGALSLVLVTNGLSLRHYFVNYHKEQWREATAYVCERADDDDIVLLNAPYVDIAFDYYHRRCGKILDHQGFSASQENLAKLPDLIAGRQRVWLIYSHNGFDDSQQLLADALGKQLRLVRDEHFYGIQLLEYARQ